MDETETLLNAALSQFWQVLISDRPIIHAVNALDAIGKASLSGALVVDHPLLCAQIDEALQRATPIVAEAVSRFMPAERLYLLMTGASRLVAEPPSALKTDRELYVALLKVELSVILCRQAIAERGDPIARNISINRALATPAPSMNLH